MTTDRIVYFGDSLSDGGTIFDVTSQLFAIPFPLASAGYQGVFSNGDVYTQIAPDLLGFTSVENFAAGGAFAVGTREIGDFGGGALAPLVLPGADLSLLEFDINLGAQVGRFLTQEALAPFEGTTTASLLIGLNDLSAFSPTPGGDAVAEGTQLVGDIVASTFGAVQALAAGGVSEFVLYTYPDATFFPFSQLTDPALLALADQLFAGHAAALNDGAATLNALGIDTTVIALDEMTDEIAADPTTFGFLSMGPILLGIGSDPQVDIGPDGISLSFAMNPAVAGLDPDQVAFFDFLHPTTALHGIFAAYTEAVLNNETAYLSDARDLFWGGRQDDFVLAGGGKDIIGTGRGDDVVFGGLDKDMLLLGRGDDIGSGGAGSDKIFGGRGSDVLAGNSGDDHLWGGRGTDALIDGLGSDYMNGGRGDDIFLVTDAALIGGVRGEDHDWINGGRGHDTLFLVVGDDLRQEVEATIDAGPSRKGRWEFDALDLRVRNVEDVVLLDSRAEFDDILVSGDLQSVLDEAELWGLV